MTQPTISRASTPVPTEGRWTWALWGLLFVLAGNMLIDALEVSASLVALPAIGADLRLTETRLQWVVSGFAVGFGSLLLFGGRLVALLGRRPVYLAALLVFAAASLAGALTDSAALLVATRFVKGFCAALTAPTGLAIITAVFPEGAARRRALSVYALFGASGFSVGLLLSGLLTDLSWRWTFAFPAPVALLLFAAGLRVIPRDGPPARNVPRRYDLAGALCLAGAAMLLVYAITSGAEEGWGHPRTLSAFLATALLTALFVRTELRSGDPLLDLRLLARGPLIRSALGAGALNGSYLGLLFVCTLHLQQKAGWSAWETGLAILPASAPLALTALYSGRFVARFGAARLIAAGAAAAPLGYALYPRDGAADVAYAGDVLPTMALVGLAFVLAFTAFHVQAIGAVSPEQQAAGGGLYQTAVQMGAAVVVALTAALHTTGPRPALALVTAVGLAGLAVALRGVWPRAADRATSDPRSRGAV